MDESGRNPRPKVRLAVTLMDFFPGEDTARCSRQKQLSATQSALSRCCSEVRICGGHGVYVVAAAFLHLAPGAARAEDFGARSRGGSAKQGLDLGEGAFAGSRGPAWLDSRRKSRLWPSAKLFSRPFKVRRRSRRSRARSRAHHSCGALTATSKRTWTTRSWAARSSWRMRRAPGRSAASCAASGIETRRAPAAWRC